MVAASRRNASGGFVICALSGATVTLFVSWVLRHFINPS
jgi:hypothetical protein